MHDASHLYLYNYNYYLYNIINFKKKRKLNF